MWAMILKEFRQVRRDRRTLAMMIVLALLLLVVFGYAASFDVTEISTVVAGPGADRTAEALPDLFEVERTEPSEGAAELRETLRDGDAVVGILADPRSPTALIDGSQLFPARTAQEAFARADRAVSGLEVEVLFNPGLETSAVMVPGLAGLILLFVGTVITSLGVVRERQAGTLEQLAVMPLRPRDVFVGKIAPYFVIAALDMAIITIVGVAVFDVPFNGSVWVLALGAVLFLFVALGLGVLISGVSQNQGQAIQLAIMMLLPQVMLSGLIFPLESMAAGVRWIGYILPLTYFNQISRGVFLRGAPLEALVQPMLLLALLGTVVFSLAVLRFRRDLAPERGRVRRPETRLKEAA